MKMAIELDRGRAVMSSFRHQSGVWRSSQLCNAIQIGLRSLPTDILHTELTVSAAYTRLASGAAITQTPPAGILVFVWTMFPNGRAARLGSHHKSIHVSVDWSKR